MPVDTKRVQIRHLDGINDENMCSRGQTSDLGGVKVELAQATHHSPQRGDKRRQKGGGAERVLLHFDVTDAVCGGCPKVRVTKSYIKL